MTDQETAGERLARQAREWVGAAGAATGRLAREGRLHLDRLALQRTRAREAQELGERVYELLGRGDGTGIAHDPVVEQHRKRIALHDAQIREHDSEIDRLRSSGPRERAERDGSEERS